MTLTGVVVALSLEARGLTEKVADECILVKCSGIGAEPARLAAEALMKKGATALLTWGSAGGLMAGLSPGSLILPEKILLPDRTSFAVDATWHERLSVRLNNYFDIHTGPLLQSPAVLTSPSEKKDLYNQYGAVAVDMESAAVVGVALRARVPFVAIRAISDTVDMIVPASALAATDDLGRLCISGLLKGLARHPEELYPVFRLGRNFRAARRTLATVLRLTGRRFLAP